MPLAHRPTIGAAGGEQAGEVGGGLGEAHVGRRRRRRRGAWISAAGQEGRAAGSARAALRGPSETIAGAQVMPARASRPAMISEK